MDPLIGSFGRGLVEVPIVERFAIITFGFPINSL